MMAGRVGVKYERVPLCFLVWFFACLYYWHVCFSVYFYLFCLSSPICLLSPSLSIFSCLLWHSAKLLASWLYVCISGSVSLLVFVCLLLWLAIFIVHFPFKFSSSSSSYFSSSFPPPLLLHPSIPLPVFSPLCLLLSLPACLLVCLWPMTIDCHLFLFLFLSVFEYLSCLTAHVWFFVCLSFSLTFWCWIYTFLSLSVSLPLYLSFCLFASLSLLIISVILSLYSLYYSLSMSLSFCTCLSSSLCSGYLFNLSVCLSIIWSL